MEKVFKKESMKTYTRQEFTKINEKRHAVLASFDEIADVLKITAKQALDASIGRPVPVRVANVIDKWIGILR